MHQQRQINEWNEATRGRLAMTSVAALLADAHAQRCTGSLIIEADARQLFALRFVRGLLVQASGGGHSAALERGALSMFLPAETLSFVEQHKERYQIDWFSAVGQLSLLPEGSLRTAQETFLSRIIEKLAQLGAHGIYRFRPGEERLKGCPIIDPALPPYHLVVAAVVADPRELARQTQLEFYEQVLALAPDSTTLLRGQLMGPARAVVESLSRRRLTLAELEQLDIIARPTLAAIVHALWLTGQIIPAGRRSKPAPSKAPADNETGFKEQALEAKVMEAWLIAEADQARVEKASVFAERAVSVFPRNPRLRFFAACLYQRADRMAEAEAEFGKALELDPFYSDAQRELARLKSRLRQSIR